MLTIVILLIIKVCKRKKVESFNSNESGWEKIPVGGRVVIVIVVVFIVIGICIIIGSIPPNEE